MVNRMYDLLQSTSNVISQLNQILYFYVNIDTKVPWAVILFMIGLYWLVGNFLKDQKMDSKELLILISGYMFFLLAIAGSYANFQDIQKTANPQYTFAMVTGVCVGIVILVAVLGASEFKQNDYKKKLILAALYTPIILLVLTNGRILHERLSSFKAIFPRSNSTIIGLPSEYDQIRIGGVVKNANLQRVRDILRNHKDIQDAAIVGMMDTDGLIKPCAFVELRQNVPASDFLKKDIEKFFISEGAKINREAEKGLKEAQELTDKGYNVPSQLLAANPGLSTYLYPRWIIYRKIPKDKRNKVRYKVLQKEAKNWSDLFAGSGGSE